VLAASGKTVRPISYTAGANSYHNALGARWRVREVEAVYSAQELLDGFTVNYADFGGTEWTLKVSPEDAIEKLLLKIPTK
jgi:hypothetical protein